MNLPTKITVTRLAMIPFIIASFCLEDALCEFPWIFIITASLYLVASLTDMLDGYIARKYKMVTTLGKFLDPIADKVLVVAGLAFGIADTTRVGIPYFMLVVSVLIIAREFAISLFRQIAASKNIILAAGKSGKYKTTFTMIALCALLFVPFYRFDNDAAKITSKVFWWMFIVSMIIATILTVYSAVEYVFKNRQVFKDKKTAVDVIEEEDVEFPDEKIIDAIEWCKENNSVDVFGMQKALEITYGRALKIRVWFEIMNFVQIENNQRVFAITDEELEKIKARKEEYYKKLGNK